MDSPENARSALDAIDTVAFKVGLKGYNVDEVDEFLERVSTESRQLKDQLHQQRQQLRQAGERINQLESGRAPTPVTTAAPRLAGPSAGAEQVTAMIAMAQQFIEHAQQEAEEKARELTVSAQERAREIVTEARGRAEDEVNRLNGLKQRLSEDVDMLARQLETERTRLTGVLSEFAHWVESALQSGGPSRPTSGAPTPAGPAGPAVQPPTSPTAPVRQITPPSAPSAHQPTIGQVLNFDQSSSTDRS